MDRENHNSDKNEQFTHQRIIRDETKKLGPSGLIGEHKQTFISFALGGAFLALFGLFYYPVFGWVLDKMWNIGGPFGRGLVIWLVFCVTPIVLFIMRYILHYFDAKVAILKSDVRQKELEEGIVQRGDVILKVYPDGGAINFSAQIEESKLMQTHPRLEPPKESSIDEQIMYYYGACNGQISLICQAVDCVPDDVYRVMEPVLAAAKLQEQEPEERYFE